MRPIFCGNFEYDAQQPDLERLFRRYGKVDRVDMKSGFAFVYMEDERDAEDAIRALDRIEFGRKGRRLRVEWTKQERIIRRPEISRRPSSNLRPSKTLFVINFDPYHTRTRDLERHFDPYGKILNVRIRRNFAFIQFESQEDATRALDSTNLSKLLDRVITVEYAVKDGGDRRNGYSPENRVRSPRRGYDRVRSPSPHRRERESPDYGYSCGHSPSPFFKERARPDYALGRPSRSPSRRERDVEHWRGLNPSPRNERNSHYHKRSPSPRKDRDSDYHHKRSPVPRKERDSNYHCKHSPNPERGRSNGGIGPGPSPSPGKKVSPDYGRGPSPSPGNKVSPDYGRGPSPSPGKKVSPDYGRGPSPSPGKKVSPDYGRGPSPSPGKKVSPDYGRGPSPSPGKKVSPDYGRGPSPSPGKKVSPDYGCGPSPSPEKKVSPDYGRGPSPSPQREHIMKAANPDDYAHDRSPAYSDAESPQPEQYGSQSPVARE